MSSTAILEEEYEQIVRNVGQGATDAELTRALVSEADWTEEGAQAVIALAREYGTAVLRNALALAEALGIEDGASGL